MFRLRGILYLLLVLASNSLLGNPQDYRYQKAFSVQSLSIDEGLSQSVVNDIIQDSDGYIWLATEDGLNRFDGYEFQVFQNNHLDPNSLSENWVHALIEEKGKGIWIGTNQGLSFYSFKHQVFEKILLGKEGDVGAVGELAIADQQLFLASDNGLFFLDLNNRAIEAFRGLNGETIEDEVVSIHTDGQSLWVATISCFYQISLETRKFNNLCQQYQTSALAERKIRIIRYIYDYLWLGTDGGVFRLDLKTNQVSLYNKKESGNSLSNDWVQDITSDNKGNIWVATGAGLNKIQLETEQIEKYEKRLHDQDGLSSEDVLSIYIDETGLVWIGTYTGGVNILDAEQPGFKHILSKSDISSFNASNTVFGVVKDDNENLWMTSFDGGVFKLNLMTGQVSQVYYAEEKGLDYVYSLLYDKDKRLWIGSTDGLFISEPGPGTLTETEFFVDGKRVKFKYYVFDLYEDHQGNILIATREGFFEVRTLEKKGKKLIVHLHNRTRELPYSYRDRSSTITTILETRDGNLWLGGPSGLLMNSKAEEVWRHFKFEQENINSLSNDDVQVIFEDSRGSLWIGTASGLNKAIRQGESDIYFERITRNEGLPNNTIYGILEDRQGQIWLSTNFGIVRYSDLTETMQSFDRKDGLSSSEFNRNAYFADNDGVLYFGSINGLTLIDSNKIIPRKRIPRLKLTQIKIGQKALDAYQLNREKIPVIESKIENNSLQVSVAELYYRKLGVQSYRYRIKGLDNKWVYLKKNRSFVISGLGEGEYLVEIESRISDGEWGQSRLEFELKLIGDFWRSRRAIYFIAFITFIILSASIYIVRRQFSERLKKQHNRLKVETIRLKEVKRHNDEMRDELAEKVYKIKKLNYKIDEMRSELDQFEFKDKATGLFKFHNLEHMLENIVDEDLLSENFNLIMVLKLQDYKQLCQKFGAICGTEIRLEVANQLKKATPAKTHLLFYDDERFILFGNSLVQSNLSSVLYNLRNQLEQSHISIANDIVVQCSINCAYIEIYPDRINRLSDLKRLSEMLVELEERYNEKQDNQVIRVDLNNNIEYYRQENLSVIQLYESNSVTIHYL